MKEGQGRPVAQMSLTLGVLGRGAKPRKVKAFKELLAGLVETGVLLASNSSGGRRQYEVGVEGE
jgi:hypothetical protein